MKNVIAIKEITPLMQGDCFTIFSRNKNDFDFPLHYHQEYELTLIINAKGAKRIVGNHNGLIENNELVLIGPNVVHGWFNSECECANDQLIQEITIQFDKSLFESHFLMRNPLNSIKKMFDLSASGILFSLETIEKVKSRLLTLNKKTGFDSVLELMSILNDLSISGDYATLSDLRSSPEKTTKKGSLIQAVFDYMNTNYNQQLFLPDVASRFHIPVVTLSRHIKKSTGSTFVSCLNEIRLGHATRMLIDTTHSISEVAYKCGFNNISNFHRVFKEKKHYTPREFRDKYLRMEAHF